MTVEVLRVIKHDATRPGTPYDLILEGDVSYADLDLANAADAATLEHRINENAHAIWEQIGKDYPGTAQKTAECARIGADQAMVQGKGSSHSGREARPETLASAPSVSAPRPRGRRRSL